MGRSRPVSRILCGAREARAAATISLGAHAPRRCSPAPCGLPGSIGRATLERSLLGLAPGGACRADAVARAAGELLPHRFTLTARDGRAAAVCFLLRLHEVTPVWVSPAPCPVESGLSSSTRRHPRPPGRLLRPEDTAQRPRARSQSSTPSFANRSASRLRSLGTCSRRTWRNRAISARTSA